MPCAAARPARPNRSVRPHCYRRGRSASPPCAWHRPLARRGLATAGMADAEAILGDGAAGICGSSARPWRARNAPVIIRRTAAMPASQRAIGPPTKGRSGDPLDRVRNEPSSIRLRNSPEQAVAQQCPGAVRASLRAQRRATASQIARARARASRGQVAAASSNNRWPASEHRASTGNDVDHSCGDQRQRLRRAARPRQCVRSSNSTSKQPRGQPNSRCVPSLCHSRPDPAPRRAGLPSRPPARPAWRR